ncbi:response regulator [Lusitaniella coriacea]|uniref:response regulator n=1 Tax=Lusitaniella coriacea TaxID=1983105 RepID=UPI003CF789EE
MRELFRHLKKIQGKQATGKLSIQVDESTSEPWQIYFHLGRIVWVTGGKHRIRRWIRTLKQHGPNLLSSQWLLKTSQRAIASEQGMCENWEVQILNEAFEQGEINLDCAKAIVQKHVQEIFFSLLDRQQIAVQWTSMKDLPQQFVWLYIDRVVEEASDFHAQWKEVISGQLEKLPIGLSPNSVPFIKKDWQLQTKLSPSTYQNLVKKLNGQNTFWDLAVQFQQPVIPVIRSLLPFICEDAVGIKEVPDLSLPRPKRQPKTPNKGKIVCIDDSPFVGKQIATLLEPLGYQVISILDPLKSIQTLLQQKPQLIFLDLVMPSTNGYELCSFLRKTSEFKKTPIVMLTGRDGAIDRLRAKMVGSNQFLSKPVESTAILQTVEKFLGQESQSLAMSKEERSQSFSKLAQV